MRIDRLIGVLKLVLPVFIILMNIGESTGQCSITNVVAMNTSCSADGNVVSDICFDFANPLSGNVEVFFDNASQGSYTYPAASGGCVTVNSTVMGTGAVINVTVRDASSNNSIYISEFHYDNAGADVNEFIEITGPAGTNLTGYTIALYNGGDGDTYSTSNLMGTIADEGAGCGIVFITPSSFQNGPDAIALVDNAGNVLQFISYEGTVTANSGPAVGMTSIDIGISETGTTPTTASLALVSGAWVVLDPATPGVINTGATCDDSCEATASLMSPTCCSEITADASAFCTDSNNGFVPNNYYIEIANVSGGINSGSYDVTVGGTTQTFTGSALTFGPFAHSGIGNAVQSTTISETTGTCSTTIEVVETLCVDLNGDGIPDNDLGYCNCVNAQNEDTPGTIVSQCVPGTFESGGASNYLQYYVLLDFNSGSGNIVAVNQTGQFTGLAPNMFYVYAVNVEISSMNVLNALMAGNTINVDDLIAQNAPYDTDCYSVCGPATYELDCSNNDTVLACNGNLNVAVNSNCVIGELSPSQFLEGTIDNPDFYEIILEDANGNVIDYDQSTATTADDLTNYIGDLITYTVNHVCNEGTCWGNVTFEGKQLPELDCDCPVGGDGGVYGPECTFSCYDNSLVGALDNLPADIDAVVNSSATDCSSYEVINFYFEDNRTDLPVCSGEVFQRTWYVVLKLEGKDATEEISCTKEYMLMPLSITNAAATPTSPDPAVDKTVYLPVKSVEIDCGTGADNSPEYIDDVLGSKYAYPHYYVDGVAIPVVKSFCNIQTTYTDHKSGECAPGCLENKKIIRKWTIVDWCTSEVIEYNQIVEIIDDIGPDIFLPDDITVGVEGHHCTTNVLLPTPDSLLDVCTGISEYYIDDADGTHTITGSMASGYSIVDLESGVHDIEYVGVDCCGNESRAILKVTVKDDQSPNAVAEEYIAVPITRHSSGEVFAKVRAISVNNGSYDHCSDVALSIRRDNDPCNNDDDEWGDHVKFCCSDLSVTGSDSIRVYLRVVDECDNSSVVQSTIYLQDKSTDELTCPEGVLLECTDSIPDPSISGIPTLIGICGDIPLNIDEDATILATVPARKDAEISPTYDLDGDGRDDDIQAYDETCGYGAYKRDFIDTEGDIICSQYFVLEPDDSFDLNDIDWPDDITVNCMGGFDEPEVDLPICGKVAITVESDTFPGVDDFCFAILNEWTVLNWCEYQHTNGASGIYKHVQSVKVKDDTDPVINVQNEYVFESRADDCVMDQITLSINANDNSNCPDEILTWVVEIDYFSDGTNDQSHLFMSSIEDSITIELMDLPVGKQEHTIHWFVTDLCDNTTQVTSSLVVEDKLAPTSYCRAIVTTADASSGTFELWAIDFNAGSFDNCTQQDEVRFTFTDVPPPASSGFYDPVSGQASGIGNYNDGVADSWDEDLNSSGRLFSVDDLDDDGHLTLEIYVWDECENNQFCIIRPFIAVDTTSGARAMIAGNFETEEGLIIDEVMAQLTAEQQGFDQEIQTDDSGAYAFENNVMDIDYEIRGLKNHDPLNGVSTLDLILIQRHILGVSLFGSPYKMIAADINNDHQINGIDLVELRKLILGIYTEYPENLSWKFVDQDQDLLLENPWLYNESIVLKELNRSMMEEDFIGVKIGDVNGSNTPNDFSQDELSRRTNSEFLLSYDDVEFESGNEYILPLFAQEGEFHGYQLELDISELEIVNIQGRDLAEDNIRQTDELLRISQNSELILEDSEALLILTIKPLSNGRLSDLLKVVDSGFKSEAYVGKYLDALPVRLTDRSEEAFILYQNRPNPFTDETEIQFNLPEDDRVKLLFYDVSGRLVQSLEVNSQKGLNSVMISKSDIGQTGLLYYRLESSRYFSTRQLIILD